MNGCGCGDPRCIVGQERPKRYVSLADIKRDFFPDLYEREAEEERRRLEAEPRELETTDAR